MIHLSWEDIKRGAEDIAAQVMASSFEPTYLIGITVGGLVPLALIAKELEMQRVATVSASSYDGNEKKGLKIRALPNVDLSQERVLLIDDISDTGDTLQNISQLLKDEYAVSEVQTAVMVSREDKKAYEPDFYARGVDNWVVFPWEKGVEKASKD